MLNYFELSRFISLSKKKQFIVFSCGYTLSSPIILSLLIPYDQLDRHNTIAKKAGMTSMLRIFNKGRSDKIEYIDSILNDERPSNEEINKQFEALMVCKSLE